MKLIPEIKIELSDKDVEIILGWYEKNIDRHDKYGPSTIIFPQEEILLQKIKNASNGSLTVLEFELESILEWMGKSLFPKFGSDTIFLPHEEQVVNKLNEAMWKLQKAKKELTGSKSEEDKEKKKQEARQLADYFINEKIKQKNLKEKNKQEIDAIDDKIRRIRAESGPILEARQAKKNRSIDNKITAANKLKSRLDYLNKILKFY